MEEFNYLLRKRSKALSLFDKVIARLSSLQQELNSLITQSSSEIEKAKKEIDNHTSKIQFLNTELDRTTQQRANVEKLIGVGEQTSL